MALNRPQVIASAEKLVTRGKIEAAIKEYRKLLAENPNDASTLNRLGDLFVRVERIDEAVRLFSQIADRYTDDGFFVKAIAIYKKIIKLDPTRLSVYERLAELYHRQGLVPEARTQYQVLVDYYQKHANATAAIGILERLSALVPEDPAPHVKLAELYRGQKATDKALAEYRLIADLMLRHGKVDEATQVFGKAIEAEPGDIAFITDAVLGLKDAGHTGAAARLLALAIEKNPQAEKIARLAGLGRATAPSEAPTRELRVSDITHPGKSERELLKLDRSLLDAPAPTPAPPRGEAPSFFPPPKPAVPVAPPAPPVVSAPFVPTVPEPPVSSLSNRIPAATDEEIDLVLELPDELEPPGTLISPTDEMLERSPESPWFEVAGGGEVEFELELESATEIEGLQVLEKIRPSAPEPMRPEPLAAPPPTAQPIQTSLSPFESAGDGYEIDWQFEPEPTLEIPEIAAPPARPAPLAPVAGQLNVEELERTSYEVVPGPATGARRHDDLLAEAEVFRKYGLREKAHDRLRELLQAEPRHLGAHALLATLWIDEGKHDKALARANQIARRATESGDDSVWTPLRARLVRAGFTLDGNQVTAPPTTAPKKKDKLAAMLDDLAGVVAGPARPAPRAPAAPAVAPPAAKLAPPPLPAAATPPPAPIRPAMPGDLLDEELPGIVLPILKTPAVPPAGRAAASALPPPPIGEPERPYAASPQGIAADESLSWLDRAVAQPAPQQPGTEKLFDDEEGFFDLAAELESELSKEELLSSSDLVAAPQEQSLEEIVEGFKRGVAESLSSEDYDTHYNLGIAYREMGLLDEAIGEFQLASKEPRYLVDCASLLGGCFLEKGLPELAIKWYRRGLEVPNLPEEAFLGLLYDLGNVHIFVGDPDKARATFVEIYGVNSNYRDVVAKLAELGAHH